MQFRLDAQIHVDVQRVVVGDEGTGRRADLQRAQHGGIDLEVAVIVHEFADGLDDLRALDEGIAHFGVDDHVEVALAVAGVHVLEAVELLRQGMQAFGEQRDLLRVDADLAHLRAENDALDAHDVAQVKVLELFVGFLADVVAADVDLDLPIAIEHMGETGLAHHTARHHAAGDGDGLAVQRLEVFQNFPGAMGLVVAGEAIGVAALGLQSAQLFQADAVLFGYFLAKFLGHGEIPPRSVDGPGARNLRVRTPGKGSAARMLCGARQRRVISSTFSLSAPPGVCASTTSPTCAPISALPMGDSPEI